MISSRDCRKRAILCALLIFLVLPLSRTAWAWAVFPKEEWPLSIPEEQGISSAKLTEMMELIKQKRLHIDSLLIVRNGHIILDSYFWPFTEGQPHIIHSCTKSIMSALIGIAIEKGYLKGVDQSLAEQPLSSGSSTP